MRSVLVIGAVTASVMAASCGPIGPAVTVPAPPATEVATVVVPDAPAPVDPLVARTVPAVDTRFGLTHDDPYRWMELATNAAELESWFRAQAAATVAYIARIPARDALFARVRDLGLGASSVYGVKVAGRRMFYYAVAPGAQLATLHVREANGTDRVLVDPTTRGDAGGHASIDTYAPSPDGKLVAYNLMRGGGEVGAIHVVDVATGTDLPDVIDQIWGENEASWLDDRAFFYIRMVPASPGVDRLQNQTTHLHRLGEPVERDTFMLGVGRSSFPLAPEDWPQVSAAAGSPWLVATAGGAHSELRIAVAPRTTLAGERTPWRAVAERADLISDWDIHGDRLYLLSSNRASNRQLLSVPLANPDLAKARVEVAEDPAIVLVGFAVARDALYLRQMIDGRARIVRRPWRGGGDTTLALPFEGWIPGLASDELADGVTFALQGWTRPSTIYAVRAGKVVPTGLATTSTADYSNIQVDQVVVTSPDGARVPLSILRRKDLVLDGSHPTYLYGYGAYGASQTPGFSPSRLAWLERGGVAAIAHVRGGGEKGRAWQDTGTREHKLNGIRDFIACGEYLVTARYTTASRLVATGASMGGVLVGRAVTERPDLFAAANIGAGIVNPLRILVAENGANQKVELGDPTTEAGYRSIAAVDPYLHVTANTPYPALIFTVGLNDHRVAPWMTAKLAARLQAATTSKRPILVRVDAAAGHGVGSTADQYAAERADVWAVFLAITGDPDFAPKP